MLRLTAVTPLNPPHLRVEFNDGVMREIDCSFLLHGTLGEPLKDPEYFRQVRVDDELRRVVWPNGRPLARTAARRPRPRSNQAAALGGLTQPARRSASRACLA